MRSLSHTPTPKASESGLIHTHSAVEGKDLEGPDMRNYPRNLRVSISVYIFRLFRQFFQLMEAITVGEFCIFFHCEVVFQFKASDGHQGSNKSWDSDGHVRSDGLFIKRIGVVMAIKGCSDIA